MADPVSWRRSVVAALLSLCLQGLASDANAQTVTNKFRAFYYDVYGVLLQIEDVSDRDLASRKLVSVNDADTPIPLLTRQSSPLTFGAKIPMSKDAAIAVYYTFDGTPQPGNPNVQAKPKSIEYLGFVSSRTLQNCLPKIPDQPCLFPKRCHCMTGGCCCY